MDAVGVRTSRPEVSMGGTAPGREGLGARWNSEGSPQAYHGGSEMEEVYQECQKKEKETCREMHSKERSWGIKP